MGKVFGFLLIDIMWILVSCLIVLGSSLWLYRRYGSIWMWYARFYKMGLTAGWFYHTYEHVTRDVAFHLQADIQADISPGAGNAPRLDVYSPADGTDHPVFVFVHGGGWNSYTKKVFASVAMTLLPQNIVVVVPDYTLHPAGDYEQMVGEVATAICWTLKNINTYGGDLSRVVVAGHSAGGHLAMLATLDPRYLAHLGHSSTEIFGLVGLSGVYDCAVQHQFGQELGVSTQVMEAVMHGPENYRQASPITYVRGDLPPLLLIHGGKDETVPVRLTDDFHIALQRVGASSQVIIYPNADHTDYLFDAFSQQETRFLNDLTAFIYGQEQKVTSVPGFIQAKS